MGSLHAAARKPGKVKGLERITTAFGKVAENYLPPSFIEVSLCLEPNTKTTVKDFLNKKHLVKTEHQVNLLMFYKIVLESS